MRKITATNLLDKLPPFKDDWIKIKEHQKVDDIISQIRKAHQKYASYYDRIAIYFDAPTIKGICDNLYNFCKKEIQYDEEPNEEQTTALPTGILYRGFGDCKHYASFIGGCLDGLSRLTGKDIDWFYRFAAYENRPVVHHVFVVVNDNGQELWIDPTPSANDLTPTSWIDKHIKIPPMALYENIGSVYSNREGGYNDNNASIGWTVDTSYGWTNSGPTMVPKVGDPYYGQDWLGLSRYGATTNTDLNVLTQQLQQKINEGPSPYTLSIDLVKKILKDNVAYWNFFYPNGTSPVPRNWQNDPDLKNYLMLTITPDGRLTFDRDEEPPHDWKGIHHLTDWTNFLVQAYSDDPYIPLIDHMKRLGKGWKTPDGGSLWHIIHTGDKNFAKITNFISHVPGLKEVLEYYGVDLDQIIKQATKVFAASQSGGAHPGVPTTGQIPAGGWNPSQPASNNNQLLYSAAAALLTYYLTKKITYAAAAGVGAYLIMQQKQQPNVVTNSPVLKGLYN